MLNKHITNTTSPIRIQFILDAALSPSNYIIVKGIKNTALNTDHILYCYYKEIPY